MTTPEPGAPAPSKLDGAPGRLWLHVLLPHALTAAIAIAISLAVLFAIPITPAAIPQATPTVAPAPSATPLPPSPTPRPPPPLAEGISRQELADLRAEVDRIWSVIYLSRAISQVADAEQALRTNDRQTMNQSLVAVDDSLALAYERADESVKNPIDEFRRELSTIRDDLYLRPEGMDGRFVRLRQRILALVEARQ